MFRYLRTGLSNLATEEIDELENYCLALGIRGRKSWENRFYAHSQRMDPGRVPALEEMRGRVMTVLAPFTEAMHSRKRTVKSCCEALYAFLLSLDAQTKMEKKRQEFEECGEAALAREYAQIYRAVMDLMDKMVEILGEEPVSIRDFAQLMEEGLMELRIGIIPPTADQVLIGDVERTRLKSLKALFFVGVNDQVIPGGLSSGGLLSETDRDTLEQMAVELAPSPRETIFIQKFYLYLHLTKPSSYVSVSYAASSAKGEQTGPAYLFGTLRRLFPTLRLEAVQPPERISQIDQTSRRCSSDSRRKGAVWLPFAETGKSGKDRYSFGSGEKHTAYGSDQPGGGPGAVRGSADEQCIPDRAVCGLCLCPFPAVWPADFGERGIQFSTSGFGYTAACLYGAFWPSGRKGRLYFKDNPPRKGK